MVEESGLTSSWGMLPFVELPESGGVEFPLDLAKIIAGSLCSDSSSSHVEIVSSVCVFVASELL